VLAAVTDAPAICVGHSVSAMIGMLANVKCPDQFAAQVMVGPSPCYINDGDYVGGFERSDIESLLETLESNYLGWSSNMAPAIMGAPDQPELAVELTNSFCRTDPEIAKQFARVTFLSDHRADLPKLQAPTLVLQCSEDLIAPMAVGEYLQPHDPQLHLRVIENVGHCPHLSAPSASADAMEAVPGHSRADGPLPGADAAVRIRALRPAGGGHGRPAAARQRHACAAGCSTTRRTGRQAALPGPAHHGRPHLLADAPAAAAAHAGFGGGGEAGDAAARRQADAGDGQHRRAPWNGQPLLHVALFIAEDRHKYERELLLQRRRAEELAAQHMKDQQELSLARGPRRRTARSSPSSWSAWSATTSAIRCR
jgi:hypothetical protein